MGGSHLRRSLQKSLASYASVFLVAALLFAPLIASSCGFGVHPHDNAHPHHLCAAFAVVAVTPVVTPTPRLAATSVLLVATAGYLARRTPPRANGSRAPPLAAHRAQPA
jgi:hypothetical protein